jgi:putative FmdB family regulatory protein
VEKGVDTEPNGRQTRRGAVKSRGEAAVHLQGRGSDVPLFDYRCARCGKKTTLLFLPHLPRRPVCPECGSEELARLPSRFAVHKTEASRLKELDTRKRPDESYYRDDRNIGLWAKKRTKELGVDLGEALDEKIEKARTTKIEDLLKD